MRARRRPLLLVPAVALALTLSGCGALEQLVGAGQPERDPDTGEVVDTGDASVLALEVGDCLVSLDAFAGEFRTVPTTPCAEPHEAEVYAGATLPPGDFPGDEAMGLKGDDLCFSAFEDFVGTPYAESALDFMSMYPTEDGWNRLDDREIICILLTLDGPVTGTLEGSGR